jgi:hypothetical protein
MNKLEKLVRLSLIMLLLLGMTGMFVLSSVSTAEAKYCPQCGTYNTDSNAFCTKCGADLKGKSFGNKPRVGVLFVANVYPYQDARFTIYHKGNVTPFLVWNSEGKYEIGEVTLPILNDIDFIPVLEHEIPSPTSVPYLSKRYNIEKLMVINMNARKVERVPLFSSQRYDLYMDITAYTCPSGEIIQEKRYKDTLNGYPDITANQVKTTCNGVWQQFVPNIYSLLRR